MEIRKGKREEIMNIIIKKVETQKKAIIANELLTKLIKYESKFDININKNFVVKNFYQNKLNKDNCIAIAYNEEDEILGYIYGYIENYDVYMEPVACIDAIYIEEKYRQNHIATKLVDYFIKWAKDNNGGETEINVLTNNVNAFEVYEHLGFKTVKCTMKRNIK